LLAPGKDLLFVTAVNTIGSVMSAIFWLFIASLISVQDYGRVNYYVSLSLLLSAFSLLGLNTTIIIFVAKGNEKLKYQANLLVVISNCFIAILLLIFIKHISSALLLIGISFCTMSWSEVLGRKEYKKYSVIVIVQRSCQVALSLLLYFVIGLDGLIIGFALSTLLVSYNFFKSFKQVKLQQFNELMQKSSFIMDSYFQAISNAVTLYVDKILIAPLFGFSMLGLYQISFQFLLFLSIIPLSLFHFLLPREAAQIHTKKFVIIGLIASLISSIGFFIAIPSIIRLFFPHFTQSIQASQIMIFSIVPMTINSILISKLFGRENSRPVLMAAAIYISTLLLLLIGLGHILGLIGLAFSLIISSTAQAIALFIMSRRIH
jgi:O-antigen/teichoic acid export membrane protein